MGFYRLLQLCQPRTGSAADFDDVPACEIRIVGEFQKNRVHFLAQFRVLISWNPDGRIEWNENQQIDVRCCLLRAIDRCLETASRSPGPSEPVERQEVGQEVQRPALRDDVVLGSETNKASGCHPELRTEQPSIHTVELVVEQILVRVGENAILRIPGGEVADHRALAAGVRPRHHNPHDRKD